MEQTKKYAKQLLNILRSAIEGEDEENEQQLIDFMKNAVNYIKESAESKEYFWRSEWEDVNSKQYETFRKIENFTEDKKVKHCHL